MAENLQAPAARWRDPSRRDDGGEDLPVGALRPVGFLLSLRPGPVPAHRRTLGRGAGREGGRGHLPPRACGRWSAARAVAGWPSSSRATTSAAAPAPARDEDHRGGRRRHRTAGRRIPARLPARGQALSRLLGIPRRQDRAGRGRARSPRAGAEGRTGHRCPRGDALGHPRLRLYPRDGSPALLPRHRVGRRGEAPRGPGHRLAAARGHHASRRCCPPTRPYSRRWRCRR